MTEELEQKFIYYCQKSLEIEGQSIHAPDLEPLFLSLLKLVKEHPEQRNLFAELFLSVASWKIPASPHLLEFCMRELQYPEIERVLQQELKAGYKSLGWARRMNYVNSVLNVYEVDWREEDIWPYFYNRKQS